MSQLHFYSYKQKHWGSLDCYETGKKVCSLATLIWRRCCEIQSPSTWFQCLPGAKSRCICDLKSCTITNDNYPWKIFPGCWHSFHDKCLNGSLFCPICQKLLEYKTKELAATAKEAIFKKTPSIPVMVAQLRLILIQRMKVPWQKHYLLRIVRNVMKQEKACTKKSNV